MKRLPHFRTAIILLVLVATTLIARAQVPGIITYQGRVSSNGAGYTGTGQFRFVIYRNAPGAITHWSHDNSSIGGGIPLTALSLPVANGLFSVGLGDITVQGMQTQIAPTIFNNAGLRLRIWFSDGANPAGVIADHALTSAGYAMVAASVPDASITSAKIASGAVTSTQLADNIQLTSLNFLGDGVGTVDLLASTSAGQGARFTMRNGLGAQTAVLDGDASGRAGSLALYNNTNKLTVLVDADESSGAGGIIEVFDNAGLKHAELDGQGASGGGELVLSDADGTTTVNFRAADSATTGARMEMHQADGTRTVSIDAEGSTGGGVLELFKSNGTRTIYLDADSAGDGRISTQVLEITGGSDFSENFNIHSDDPQPGMLVRIDPAHPGELAISDRAYDRTVAGVVSGAGGVKPGLRMGQRDSVADGKYPVALTGRVYCFVDADRGAIEPGDLITTSDTPGHGMKVDDHARAQGAVIGKAMTRLASGRGLVLLLVNLH